MIAKVDNSITDLLRALEAVICRIQASPLAVRFNLLFPPINRLFERKYGPKYGWDIFNNLQFLGHFVDESAARRGKI